MKELFWKLFNVNDENELNNIVQNNDLLSNKNNWYPYGGNSYDDKWNFATFESQQPDSIAALIEKITNSIDSILLKHCRLNGINPKSNLAPKTMAEAVEKYFNIKNGDFSEYTEPERRSIAENVQIIATGDKNSPNLIIYDFGEGQHPDDFKNTFLSLHLNNKTDIKFVQGKYNQGATGAVVFCGEFRYQLIASKLDNKLYDIEKKKKYKNKGNDFGFTLIRRHPLTEEQEQQYGCSWYEYFIVDGKIPRFQIDSIDLGLYKMVFKTGSIIKLYSYHLPRGSRSDITFDLWRDLNQFMYLPAIPVLVYEKRYGKAHSLSKLMLGNKTRMMIDDNVLREKTIPITIKTEKTGRIDIEATVFKYGVKKKEFIKNRAIVFTLNGQVNGFLTSSFISQNLGLSMLRDYLLIQVDCTNMRTSFRQDLFMANRYNLKGGPKLEFLLDILIDKIKGNEVLKNINENRKNKIIRESIEDKNLIKILMESIPLDKNLLNILKRNGDLNFLNHTKEHKEKNQKSKTKKEKQPYVSKRFPSIFNIDLKENKGGKRIKSIPLNGKGIIRFETNVEDDYLFRPMEKGELQLQILGVRNNDVSGVKDIGKPTKVENIFDVTIEGPSNNSIKFTFEPKQILNVGEEIKLNAKLTSPSGDLSSIFYVKIVNPKIEVKKPKIKKIDQPAIPKPIKVFKKKEKENDKDWNDLNWKGDDIVKVYSENNIIEAIAINMDSYSIKRFISKKRVNSEKSIKLIRDKFFINVYLHSLFLYSIINKLNNESEDNEFIDLEVLIPTVFKSYSSFLLYMNTNDEILNSIKDE